MRIEQLKSAIREIPDFPKPGIRFYDVCTLFREPRAFGAAVGALADPFRERPFDLIAGIESRGFVLGAALARELGLGFVMIRKAGKLPGKTVSEAFALEYGRDRVEMHVDAIGPGHRVLLVDDVLATGGTASAAVRLIRKAGGELRDVAFMIELDGLKGRSRIDGADVFSLIHYD